MQITSPVFVDGGNLPAKYTCLGKGVNPPLEWSQVPVNTKTLALIVDDPDAPGGVFSHWVLWDIPVAITGVAENSLPLEAVVGVESSGTNEYFAPCPPSGAHRYRFKLYALDKELFLSINTRQADLERAMNGHVLGEAILTGLFEK